MRAVLILLGLLLAQPVWAGWVELGSANSQQYGRMTIYFDPATVRKTAEGRRVWFMHDLDRQRALPSGTVYQSQRVLYEFDCTEERYRTLQETHYSAPMLTGLVVGTWSGQPTWKFIEPGTATKSLIEAACKASLPN